MNVRIEMIRPLVVLTTFLTIGSIIGGCASDSQASKGAQQGAMTGAVGGAVAGAVGALLWGGNVGEAAAKSAVVGASAGAATGAMSGAQRDKAAAQRDQVEADASLAEVKKKMGDDAYNGLVALAECKHDVAIANAREAEKSKNKDFALAGLWVEVLTEADRRDETKARSLFPDVVAKDRKIKTEAEAEERMRAALQELMDIRASYDMPRVCSA